MSGSVRPLATITVFSVRLRQTKKAVRNGKNVHCAILDEIHAHKDSETYDIMADGVIARREPLVLGITTAGSDKKIGVCWRERCKVTRYFLW